MTNVMVSAMSFRTYQVILIIIVVLTVITIINCTACKKTKDLSRIHFYATSLKLNDIMYTVSQKRVLP